LKNQEIVAEGEKLFKSFKAVDYDLQAQLKAIAAFEAKAVSRSFRFFQLLRAVAARWAVVGGCSEGGRPVGRLRFDLEEKRRLPTREEKRTQRRLAFRTDPVPSRS